MANRGILILCHQGFSYCKEIHAVCKQLGLGTFILSSQPKLETAPLREIGGEVAWLHEATRGTLMQADVEGAMVALRNEGFQVVGAIATMEGYRLLAAAVNAGLGANDSERDSLMDCMDKLTCRDLLRTRGLSAVECEVLTEVILEKHQRQGKVKFIKPRRGAAGYGVQRLKPDTRWASIEALQTQMKADTLIESVFYGNYEFLIEDMLSGEEFSFEVIAFAGAVYLIASHQKGNEIHGDTILEIFHWSPPTDEDFSSHSAHGYLKKVLAALGLDYGCFHIEMKRDQGRWEIVEINPRVGGSLINDNVKEVAGYSMLELWVELLAVGQDEHLRQGFAAKLAAISESQRIARRPRGAVFRQYFADPKGGTVTRVIDRSAGHGAKKANVYTREGAVIPALARETILGEALWSIPADDFSRSLEAIKARSGDAIEIELER